MKDNDNQPADAESTGEESSTLGRTLKAAREQRELSLEQVAGELRMEPRLLAALEQDRLEALGPPVFAKGYLKQYAQRLGLDYGDLLVQYYRQVDEQEVPILPPRPIKLRDERRLTTLMFAGLALVLVAVVLLVWWLSAPSTPVPVPQIESGSPAGSTPPASSPPAMPGPRIGEAAVPDPVRAPAQDAGSSGSQPTLAAREAAGDPTAAPVLRVEIGFAEDCWTEVVDARGERLFYGLARAGARARFSGVAPLSFLLGNANGVRLLVNGAPYPIPRAGRQGNLARFSVSEAGP